jgi:very-short-patch-repair endonuclease
MVYLGKTKVKDMFIGARSELFRLAHDMRQSPTEAEGILWEQLRKCRSSGFIFRRQHPIDFYIADFYCHKIKLVIEVDGDIHTNYDVKEHDDNRSGELERFGIVVIRFTNDEIINELENVMSEINIKISEPASPAPPGAGDGRG